MDKYLLHYIIAGIPFWFAGWIKIVTNYHSGEYDYIWKPMLFLIGWPFVLIVFIYEAINDQ